MPWHGGGVVAWAHAIYQYHVNGTDTVGRSVDARGPVDHASVRLAQARPNYNDELGLCSKGVEINSTVTTMDSQKHACWQ